MSTAKLMEYKRSMKNATTAKEAYGVLSKFKATLDPDNWMCDDFSWFKLELFNLFRDEAIGDITRDCVREYCGVFRFMMSYCQRARDIMFAGEMRAHLKWNMGRLSGNGSTHYAGVMENLQRLFDGLVRLVGKLALDGSSSRDGNFCQTRPSAPGMTTATIATTTAGRSLHANFRTGAGAGGAVSYTSDLSMRRDSFVDKNPDFGYCPLFDIYLTVVDNAEVDDEDIETLKGLTEKMDAYDFDGGSATWIGDVARDFGVDLTSIRHKGVQKALSELLMAYANPLFTKFPGVAREVVRSKSDPFGWFGLQDQRGLDKLIGSEDGESTWRISERLSERYFDATHIEYLSGGNLTKLHVSSWGGKVVSLSMDRVNVEAGAVIEKLEVLRIYNMDTVSLSQLRVSEVSRLTITNSTMRETDLSVLAKHAEVVDFEGVHLLGGGNGVETVEFPRCYACGLIRTDLKNLRMPSLVDATISDCTNWGLLFDTARNPIKLLSISGEGGGTGFASAMQVGKLVFRGVRNFDLESFTSLRHSIDTLHFFKTSFASPRETIEVEKSEGKEGEKASVVHQTGNLSYVNTLQFSLCKISDSVLKAFSSATRRLILYQCTEETGAREKYRKHRVDDRTSITGSSIVIEEDFTASPGLGIFFHLVTIDVLGLTPIVLYALMRRRHSPRLLYLSFVNTTLRRPLPLRSTIYCVSYQDVEFPRLVTSQALRYDTKTMERMPPDDDNTMGDTLQIVT